MLWGWAREVIRQHRRKLPVVIYRTPCGHQLYNTYEVHQYLRLTGSQLGVDLFSFDSCSDSCSRPIQCFKKFKPAIIYSSLDDNSSLYCLKQFLLISFELLDITDGKGNARVFSVNSFDRSDPPFVKYTTKRIPGKGVDMNTKVEFLVCCDCTDDCQDKEKCQCWQLTIQVN